MIEFSLLAFLAGILSLLLFRMIRHRWAASAARSLLAIISLVVMAGGTIFVADGFGWGWSTLSRLQYFGLVLCGGLGVGCSFVAFAWITSRRLSLTRVFWLLVTNLMIVMVLGDWETVRMTLFGLINAALLFEWLCRTSRPSLAGGAEQSR